MRYFQTKIITPPVIIPASAPSLLERFQNNENNTIGPKVAPNPAQAKETISKTELLGSLAIKTAMTAKTITDTLAIPDTCNTSG